MSKLTYQQHGNQSTRIPVGQRRMAGGKVLEDNRAAFAAKQLKQDETAQRVEEEDERLKGKSGASQLAKKDEEEIGQAKLSDRGPPVQREEQSTKPNNTGLPDNLKSGIENLSGMSMDHVKVHYNSSQPAQLNALAYTQGADIHVAPGQEQHLPHEAWHVVQQAQGRVRPTMQMKEGVPVNDDKSLEHEADVMGAKALQMKVTKSGIEHTDVPENPAENLTPSNIAGKSPSSLIPSQQSTGPVAQQKAILQRKPATNMDIDLEYYISGEKPENGSVQKRSIEGGQSSSLTGDAVVQGMWYHTKDADSNSVHRWIGDSPPELESIWDRVTNLSLQDGCIKLVYQNDKGAHQFLYDGNDYWLICSDGTVKDGYPSEKYETIQSVFDVIFELFETAGDAEKVEAGEAEGEGAETLSPDELEEGNDYTIIYRGDESRKEKARLTSINPERLLFKVTSLFNEDSIEITEENRGQYQILEYVPSSFGEEPFLFQQPSAAQTVIAESVLSQNIYGYDMGTVLAPYIHNGEIVVQGKFIGAPTYNAPAYSKGIIQAPIGGGGAPAGNPPGWKGGKHPYHHNRGHLMGKQFGGIGGLANLVTLTDGSNHPQMSKYENILAATITANPAKMYAYKITAHYKAGWKKTNSAGATGGGGKVVIGHPAPHHVTLDAKQVGGAALFGGTVTINNGIFQNHAACTD